MMFLPPYYPDLNPQENVRKSVKEKEFKNVLCRNVNELNQNVIKAFSGYQALFKLYLSICSFSLKTLQC